MSNPNHQSRERVPVTFPGSRVTVDFRDALFDAANKAGVTPNEFVLRATAAKLLERGRPLSGIFAPGDVQEISL